MSLDFLKSPVFMRVCAGCANGNEATASLDPVAESEVYNMFGRVSRNSTTIFITHRLGAARLADDIIVLEDGAVKETGSHEELLRRGGLYAEMFKSQRSWYK